MCVFTRTPVHEIFQARILEWVAIPYTRGSSWPRNGTHVSLQADSLLLNHWGSLFFCCTLCQKIFKLIISICEYLWIIHMLIYYTYLKHVDSLKGWVKDGNWSVLIFFFPALQWLFLYPVLAITELDLLRNFFSLFSYSVSTDPQGLYTFPLFKTDNMTHCFRLS